MAYILAVTWTAKPGNEAQVAEILRELHSASNEEPGCLTYEVHVDPEDARQFFIYEVYRDAAGLEAHQETRHFRELVLEKAIALLEFRERRHFVYIEPDPGQ